MPHVVILFVTTTVTGSVCWFSCLGNTVEVWEYGEGYAQQKSKISKQMAKRKRRELTAAGNIFGKMKGSGRSGEACSSC